MDSQWLVGSKTYHLAPEAWKCSKKVHFIHFYGVSADWILARRTLWRTPSQFR